MKLFKSRKKTKKELPIELPIEYQVNAVGMQHYIENIKSIGIPNKGYTLTPKELEHANKSRYYEYSFNDVNIELVPEPDNPHDKNAIMILGNGLKIGYVSQYDIPTIKEYLKIPFTLSFFLSGGNYINNDLGTWSHGTYPYYCNITLTKA